jgi:hypothetical protein
MCLVEDSAVFVLLLFNAWDSPILQLLLALDDNPSISLSWETRPDCWHPPPGAPEALRPECPYCLCFFFSFLFVQEDMEDMLRTPPVEGPLLSWNKGPYSFVLPQNPMLLEFTLGLIMSLCVIRGFRV